MRKSLIAAAAATTVLGGAATAVAQDVSDGGSLKVTVAPQKAGTKKKPANSSVHTIITIQDTRRTLRKLEIQMPSTLTVSGKGFKLCNQGQLETTGDPSVCPKASKVGVGTAKASLGVNSPNASKLTFDVTAYVVGKNAIDFALHARELPSLVVVSPGRVKQTKKGPKLVVTVPQAAQQPTPGLYAGLSELDTTLHGTAGKHKLIASTGCKKHKQPFSTKLYFTDNGVTAAGNFSVDGAARCR